MIRWFQVRILVPGLSCRFLAERTCTFLRLPSFSSAA
jgi:hypothetical protein